MPAAKIAKHEPTARPDGRTAAAYRLRKRLRELAEAFGGRPSAPVSILIERAAHLGERLADIEARQAITGLVDENYLPGLNVMRRILADLAAEARAYAEAQAAARPAPTPTPAPPAVNGRNAFLDGEAARAAAYADQCRQMYGPEHPRSIQTAAAAAEAAALADRWRDGALQPAAAVQLHPARRTVATATPAALEATA